MSAVGETKIIEIYIFKSLKACLVYNNVTIGKTVF